MAMSFAFAIGVIAGMLTTAAAFALTLHERHEATRTHCMGAGSMQRVSEARAGGYTQGVVDMQNIAILRAPLQDCWVDARTPPHAGYRR